MIEENLSMKSLEGGIKVISIEVEPRFAETDAMGVVHHSVIPVYLEMARMKLLESHGLNYSELERKGYDLAITHYEVTLKAPICFGDKVKVEVYPRSFTGVRMLLEYRIEANGKEVAAAKTTLAAVQVDRASKRLRPVNLKKALPEEYNKLRAMFK